MAVAAIIVVGLLLVWLARESRINVGGDRPRANEDAWYQAYGTYVCDAYLADAAPPAKSSDISPLGNGLISVFPTSEDTAGENATLGKFFSSAGIKVTDSSFTGTDGTKHSAGDSCGEGKDATTDTEVKLFVWPPQASDKTKPQVVTSDFSDERFDQNQAIYALALVPASTKTIPLPSSVDVLATPTVGIPTTTAAPGDTTTTAPGDTTTTAPADTTTTAPGTTTTAPGTTTTEK